MNGTIEKTINYEEGTIMSPDFSGLDNVSIPSDTDVQGYGWNSIERSPPIDKVSQVVSVMTGNQYNPLIVTGLADIRERVEDSGKRRRKRLVRAEPATLWDETIIMRKLFDDGSVEEAEFILNAKGKVEVHRITIENESKERFFSIRFSKSNYCVIGEIKKVNGEYLRRRFVESDIQFASGLSDSLVAKVLFDAFAPQIHQTQNVWSIYKRAGWHGRQYMTKKNFPCWNYIEFADFPVMKRVLDEKPLTELAINAYFHALYAVRDTKEKIIFSLLPYMGILSSILVSKVDEEKMVINLVMLDDIPIKDICEWFCIFNRPFVRPISANQVPKRVMQEVLESRDEVVIVDCRHTNDYNEQKKVHNLQERIIKTYREERFDYSEPFELACALLFVSTNVIPMRGVLNVYFTEETIKDFRRVTAEMKRENAIEAVVTSFIKYVTQNFDDIESIVIAAKQKEQGERLLKLTLSIVSEFWKNKGFDFKKILSIEGELDGLFENEEKDFEDDELLQLFIRAIRSKAIQCVGTQKKNMANAKLSFYYNDNFLWIRPDVFEEALRESGLMAYRMTILQQCKERAVLLTDSGGGYKTRLKVGGERFEMLLFQKKFFNATGTTDISNLFKKQEE